MSRLSTTRQARRTRLGVEQLEERQLLSAAATPLTFHQGTYDPNAQNPLYPWGTVVQNVQVENVFWGSAYGKSGKEHATVKYMDTFMKYLVDSAFMDTLAQYGVGHGSFQGHTIDGKMKSHGSITMETIKTELQNLVGQGKLPAPGLSELYMVYLPPGITVSDSPGDPGKHGDPYTASGVDAQGNQTIYDFNFAFITSSKKSPNNTVVASHELAEAVTDPRVGGGWYNNAGWNAGNGGEVADLAVPNTDQLGGYTVTQLYSNKAGGLV